MTIGGKDVVVVVVVVTMVVCVAGPKEKVPTLPLVGRRLSGTEAGRSAGGVCMFAEARTREEVGRVWG